MCFFFLVSQWRTVNQYRIASFSVKSGLHRLWWHRTQPEPFVVYVFGSTNDCGYSFTASRCYGDINNPAVPALPTKPPRTTKVTTETTVRTTTAPEQGVARYGIFNILIKLHLIMLKYLKFR